LYFRATIDYGEIKLCITKYVASLLIYKQRGPCNRQISVKPG